MITKKEIGKRVARLRKDGGYSQEELSKALKISRPTLAQIEIGNRNITAIELRKISDILETSTDRILADEFKADEMDFELGNINQENKTRISEPRLDFQKMQNIILYILNKCGSKANFGKTVLNRMLYFSDFDFYEIYEEHLTGSVYKKLPYGPVPESIDNILSFMIDKEMIIRIDTDYGSDSKQRYIAVEKADLRGLRAHEIEVIDNVINKYSDWTANKISDYSHRDMPWLASDEGEIIDYELAFYREDPFSVRDYEES
jgi:transcriptional regulator with XRE-family HTH domain